MIKFFRRIRQRLVTENPPNGRAGKLSKYLVYAIGEILLVVIGILIALQLNSWNDKTKDGAEFRELLDNLKSEYLINDRQLSNRMKNNERVRGATLGLIELMTPDYQSVDVKSVDSLVVLAVTVQTFDGSSGALQDVISNNKLGLIKRDSLRIELVSWAQKADNVKDMEARVLRVQQNYLSAYIYKNCSYVKMDNSNGEKLMPISKLPFDNRKIMAEVEFETILSDYFWINHAMYMDYEDMQNAIHRILKLIEQEQSQ